MDNYLIAFKGGITFREESGDLALTGPNGRVIRLVEPAVALRSLVHNLVQGQMTAETLCDAAIQEDPEVALARLYYALSTFENAGFISYTLAANGRHLATLEPVLPGFVWHSTTGAERYRLSRFAFQRRLDNGIVLETPLGHGRLLLHDPQMAMALACLAVPHTAEELGKAVPGFDEIIATLFLRLLVSMAAAFPCNPDGRIAEDENIDLRTWEFHDLLFHSRSRAGRHEYPLGGTRPLGGEIALLPAIKPQMSHRRVTLAKPNVSAQISDVSFFTVVESRRSIRTKGIEPITASQLGAFLYYVARVKEIHEFDPSNPENDYRSSSRPCPSGGSMHELELYLTVSRCEAIPPGLYHYDPLAHELEHLADLGAAQQALLKWASSTTGLKESPDILITLTARHRRIAWKYQSVAYALIQKNVGVMQQQMYLVATALNLAPCALGGGNSEHFSEATGLGYYSEPSVGEFILSSL